MMKRLWMGLMTVLLAIAVTITINYAWFVKSYDVNPLADGSSTDAYYYSGDGSSEKPFIITNARHLYNLAWLQYLGYYNKPDEVTIPDGATSGKYKTYYFQLGIDADHPVTLDMKNWPLPPIGTTKYPFIGNFNGNGSTIINLVTTNSFQEFGTKHPSTVTSIQDCNVIGFFGSVGAFNKTIINSDVQSESNSVGDNNEIKSFTLNNSKVHTSTSDTCLGAVAGYVNAPISNVGVIQPHLNIQAENTTSTSITSKTSSNVSDFAVVGYAEAEYTTKKTKNSTIIYNPTYNYTHFNFKGMGNQADWGGSMNMMDMYNRLINVRSSVTQSPTYHNQELRYAGLDKDSLFTSQSANTRKGYYKPVSSVQSGEDSRNGIQGSYLFDFENSSTDYNYLTALYKNVIIVTKTDTIKNGYTISNETSTIFLDINSQQASNTSLNFNVSLNHSSSTQRTWVYESSKLYTYNEDDGYPYYLVANGDLSLSITNDSSSASTWNLETMQDDEENEMARFKTNINSSDYYLKYFDGRWTIKDTYAISDGNNHYIKYDTTQPNNIAVATSINDATPFMFTYDDSYPYGKIYTTQGAYIRNNNGTLQISAVDSNNSWSNTGGKLYIQYNNAPYYIQYDSGWTLKAPTTYYIEYNGNYLYLNNLGQIQTSGTSNVNDATAFSISNALLNGTGTGTISATIGNQTYYLRYDNYNTFDTSTETGTYTTWSYDGYGFYQTNNTNYYIQFRNNSWIMSSTIETTTTDYYAIGFTYTDDDEYYLNATTNSVSASTSSYSIWYVNNNNYVYTVINGVNYYLYAINSGSWNNPTYTLSISTSTSQNYMITKYNNKLRFAPYSGYNYYFYLRYDGNLSFTNTNDNSTDWQWYNSWYDFDNTPIGKAIAKGIAALSISRKSSYNGVSSTTNVYSRTTGTVEPSLYNYIPLNASKTSMYITDNNNTGYIIGGAHETADTRQADIRVSRYDRGRIGGSFDGKTISSVYTTGNNGLGTIGTDYPINNFAKYASSKSQLEQKLKEDTSYVYGLHFMDASINKSNLVIADRVLINGKNHYDYQLPEDCIDFNLASKGYINFFAGYYYSSGSLRNNSFFSLHEIFRDSSNAITDIKHISQIYKHKTDKTADFIYKYFGGQYSSASYNAGDYDLVFDYTWIENGPSYNTYKSYLFYYEIPVNKGEFALGSVDGKNGAYLIYLDIGANAAPVDRTEVRQQTKYTQETLVYANGIQVLASGSSYDNTNVANTAVAIIPKTPATGEITITRTGDTIEFNRNLNSTYYDPGITLTNGSLSPISSSSRVLNVLKYIDYKRTDDRVFYTTIYNNGSTNTAYDCYEINNSTGEVIKQITETGDGADWGLLKIDSGSGVETTVTDSYFNFPSNLIGTTKILDYYSVILTSDLTDYSDTNAMRVVEDGTVQAPNDGEYIFEHSYSITGNDITMSPDELLVYIGPELKASATITGPVDDVVTVTTRVNDITYTFKFNADVIDDAKKTVTIHYVEPE